jgi:hypothetical protein
MPRSGQASAPNSITACRTVSGAVVDGIPSPKLTVTGYGIRRGSFV